MHKQTNAELFLNICEIDKCNLTLACHTTGEDLYARSIRTSDSVLHIVFYKLPRENSEVLYRISSAEAHAIWNVATQHIPEFPTIYLTIAE